MKIDGIHLVVIIIVLCATTLIILFNRPTNPNLTDPIAQRIWAAQQRSYNANDIAKIIKAASSDTLK